MTRMRILSRRTVRAARLAAVALAGAAVFGCGDRQDTGTVVAAPEPPALRTELLVTADWLAASLEDTDVVILHVGGDEAEYRGAHIPGARFIPLGALNQERDGVPGMLPPSAELAATFAGAGISDMMHVIVYGAPLFAARAFVALEQIGQPRVSLLDGGLPAWRAGGHPLSDSPVAPVAGSLVARPTDVVVTGDWVRDRLEDPTIALIDARPPAQFTGEDPGSGIPRPGHIPGAENVFWEQLIVSAEDPRLQDVATLRALFAEHGATADRTVVTYCRTGMQSSFAYFVARYLGHQTRIYDGSFVDWSPREEYPVQGPR